MTLLLGYSDNKLFSVWHELTDGGSQTSTIPKIHGRPKLLPFVGYRLITCIKVTECCVFQQLGIDFWKQREMQEHTNPSEICAK